VALESYPEYRAQLKALLEVVSLIRPLAEDVAPPPTLRESVWARLPELQDEPTPSLFHAGGEPSTSGANPAACMDRVSQAVGSIPQGQQLRGLSRGVQLQDSLAAPIL
jgi:hypothetical protein